MHKLQKKTVLKTYKNTLLLGLRWAAEQRIPFEINVRFYSKKKFAKKCENKKQLK